MLRSGWFNPVHMKRRAAHAVRVLLSSRKAVQRRCIDLANEIRGLFRIFGLRLPSRIEQASFDEKVRPNIEADADLSHALLPLLDARAVLFSTYQELDRRVKRLASNDDPCLRFVAIPGVGPIAAFAHRPRTDGGKWSHPSRRQWTTPNASPAQEPSLRTSA